MVDESTAGILRDKLTGHGLVRELARQDISARLVHMLSIEEAARALERRMAYPSVSLELTKKVDSNNIVATARARMAVSSVKICISETAISKPMVKSTGTWPGPAQWTLPLRVILVAKTIVGDL